MSYSELPIDALAEKYIKFTSKLNAFLHGDIPTNKTELFAFISLCTSHETDLTSLRSSLGLITAEIQRDYNEILREVHDDNKPSGKRITKHEIDMIKLDSRLIDCQYKLDCLKVYIEGLDSYRWLLKFRKDQCQDHFKYLKGMDF